MSQLCLKKAMIRLPHTSYPLFKNIDHLRYSTNK